MPKNNLSSRDIWKQLSKRLSIRKKTRKRSTNTWTMKKSLKDSRRHPEGECMRSATSKEASRLTSLFTNWSNQWTICSVKGSISSETTPQMNYSMHFQLSSQWLRGTSALLWMSSRSWRWPPPAQTSLSRSRTNLKWDPSCYQKAVKSTSHQTSLHPSWCKL